MSTETLETLFPLVNLFPLPFWIWIAVAPSGLTTRRLLHSGLVIIPLALLYVFFFATAPIPEGADGTTLAGLVALFAIPQAALVGWIHYLALDLMVGVWIARDGWERGIPRVAVAPCLFLTLMAGPTGLLVYIALRGVLRGPRTLAAPIVAGRSLSSSP